MDRRRINAIGPDGSIQAANFVGTVDPDGRLAGAIGWGTWRALSEANGAQAICLESRPHPVPAATPPRGPSAGVRH